jgi:hypothetical protein
MSATNATVVVGPARAVRVTRSVYTTGDGKNKKPTRRFDWQLEVNGYASRAIGHKFDVVGSTFLRGGATLNAPGILAGRKFIEELGRKDEVDILADFDAAVAEINKIPPPPLPEEPQGDDGGSGVPRRPIQPKGSAGAANKLPRPSEPVQDVGAGGDQPTRGKRGRTRRLEPVG